MEPADSSVSSTGSSGGMSKADLFRIAIEKRQKEEEVERAARRAQLELERANKIKSDEASPPERGRGRGGRGGGGRGGSDKSKMSLRDRVFSAKRTSQVCMLVAEEGAPPRCALLLRYSGPRPQHSGVLMLRSLHVVASEDQLDLESESGPSCKSGIPPSQAMNDISRNVETVLRAAEEAPAFIPQMKHKPYAAPAAAPAAAEGDGDAEASGAAVAAAAEVSIAAPPGGYRCERVSLLLGTLLCATAVPGLQFPADHPFVSLTDLFYEIETGHVLPFFVQDSAQAVRGAARRVCYTRDLLPSDDGARVQVQLTHPEGNVIDVFTFKIVFKTDPAAAALPPLPLPPSAAAAEREREGKAPPEFELVPESVVRDGFSAQWLMHYVPRIATHKEEVRNTTAHGLDTCIRAEFSGSHLSINHPNMAKVKEAAEKVLRFELQPHMVGNHTKSASWLYKPYVSQLTPFVPPLIPPHVLLAQKAEAEAAAAAMVAEMLAQAQQAKEAAEAKAAAAAAAAAAEQKEGGEGGDAGASEAPAVAAAPVDHDDDRGDVLGGLNEDGTERTVRRMAIEDVFTKRGLVDDAIIQRVSIFRSETFHPAGAVKQQHGAEADPAIVSAALQQRDTAQCSGTFTRTVQFELASATSEPSPYSGVRHKVMRVQDNIVRSEARPFALTYVPQDFSTAEQNAAVFAREAMTFAAEMGIALGQQLSQERVAGWLTKKSDISAVAGAVPTLRPVQLDVPAPLSSLGKKVAEAMEKASSMLSGDGAGSSEMWD